MELAKRIPEVITKLNNDSTLDDLKHGNLETVIRVYFGYGPIKVVECGGQLEFNGEGRHQLAAARELDILIPVTTHP